MQMQTIEELVAKQYSSFIGKSIAKIRPLTEKEMKSFYWEPHSGDVPLAIIFEDGQVLIPSSDPECNGPGFLIAGDLS